jgi:hypothetical protein
MRFFSQSENIVTVSLYVLPFAQGGTQAAPLRLQVRLNRIIPLLWIFIVREQQSKPAIDSPLPNVQLEDAASIYLLIAEDSS